jgi:hypothetical protein
MKHQFQFYPSFFVVGIFAWRTEKEINKNKYNENGRKINKKCEWH